jgi:SAM-dependent methyltransferase
MALTPHEFAMKWQAATTTERASAQTHFNDLCAMVGVKAPLEADPTGKRYAFEKGVGKTGGGDGFADVWKQGYFAWEYKGKKKDLKAAYAQLLQYREALESPPILVVCDLNRFEIHTNFTNTPATVYEFTLEDLLNEPAEPLGILKAVMRSPADLKPGRTRADLTAEAAKKFASLAFALRGRGHDPQVVAHFLNKLLFCLFAEDAGLLPAKLVDRLTDAGKRDPESFSEGLSELFGKMSDRGGLWGPETIQWFNGGLFDGPEVLDLTAAEIRTVRDVADLDWSQVEPAIFGTLFERGLDPDKRSQLGAHYTDRADIARLTEPVLMAPLKRDFETTKERVSELLAQNRRITARTRPENNPKAVFEGFLTRLRGFRVLDPACGSGNFLYVALQLMKDLERDALLWASLTFQESIQFPEVGPEAVLGIELNPYAAELARVVVWIGQIQWMLANGFAYEREPILRRLDNIVCQDAIIDRTGSGPKVPTWPAADVIIGNPPFLGSKKMRKKLGGAYVDDLHALYKNRVAGSADLVTYWHENARAQLEAGNTARVGLLSTQSIRGGASRKTLQRIKETGDIFFGRSDDKWVVEGATVHISFVGFDDGSETERELDGEAVNVINANLTTGIDMTTAAKLKANRGIAFMGDTKGAHFDISSEKARELLSASNPDGRMNSDVVRPWVTTIDITGRPRDMYIVDFGCDMSEEDASLYEAPFDYIQKLFADEAAAGVDDDEDPLPTSDEEEDDPADATASPWWLHTRPRAKMRKALDGLHRFIATPTTSKHRAFVWMDPKTLPDHQLIVFARDDDYTMGVLQSGVHELWARAHGTQLRDVESGFRYTHTTTFETFPFPQPDGTQRASIAEAAKKLDDLRRGWLFPEKAGVDEGARTLTGFYNAPPGWYRLAQKKLDKAVLDAYGWPPELSNDDLLRHLLDLNAERAAAEKSKPKKEAKKKSNG